MDGVLHVKMVLVLVKGQLQRGSDEIGGELEGEMVSGCDVFN